jgi:hypothetical protein
MAVEGAQAPRLEALAVRRPPHARPRGRPLLHQAEGGHLALADRHPRRRRVQDADHGLSPRRGRARPQPRAGLARVFEGDVRRRRWTLVERATGLADVLPVWEAPLRVEFEDPRTTQLVIPKKEPCEPAPRRAGLVFAARGEAVWLGSMPSGAATASTQAVAPGSGRLERAAVPCPLGSIERTPAASSEVRSQDVVVVALALELRRSG